MLNTCCKRISTMKRMGTETKSFYGAKRPKFDHVQATSDHYRANPIARLHHSAALLGGEPHHWKVFCRQSEAIEACESNSTCALMAFSRETAGGGGSRNFVVTHPATFWLTMMQLPTHKRCAYEVIAQHSQCKLYFDLEFPRAANPATDGVAITATFLTVVNHYLYETFRVRCHRTDVLNLDSSSATKFSKHLIYSEKATFQDNVNAGNFVKYVCDQIERLVARGADLPACQLSHADLSTLMVRDAHGKLGIFCDTAVYTKNRNFRLFKCTKFGKREALEVAPENQFLPVARTEEDTFYTSLITRLQPQPTEWLTFAGLNSSSGSGNSGNGGSRNIRGATPIKSDTLCAGQYPKIDAFIQSIIGCGSIRKCTRFDQSQVLLYDISNYRYCHNIGREHKSNGIMYVVNLASGVYYQKCYDPDCHGYRSNEMSLPVDTERW